MSYLQSIMDKNSTSTESRPPPYKFRGFSATTNTHVCGRDARTLPDAKLVGLGTSCANCDPVGVSRAGRGTKRCAASYNAFFCRITTPKRIVNKTRVYETK